MAIGSIKDKGSLENILWLERMGDVNDISLGINAQNDALHAGNISVTKAKISGQSYYRSHPLFSSGRFAEVGNYYGKDNENDTQDDGEPE
jgi:hypothetical protein